MGTTIRVRCTDQVLTFENTPVIASGGREVDSVHFEFCGKWEGSVRTAVFWRSPTEAYHVLLDDSDTCAIPREVLQADGLIYFGVFGVYPDGRQRPTEVLTYRVVKGTITEGTKPTDPAPDIYTQLQAAYADALAKMAAYQANTERLLAEHLAEMEQTVEGYHDDNAKHMAAHEQTVAAAMAQHEQAVENLIVDVVAAANGATAAANEAAAAAKVKADKVSGATAGNFAGLDADGNLIDSGKKAADFVEKPAGVTPGHIAMLSAGGGLADGGVTTEDIIALAVAAGLKVELGTYAGTLSGSSAGGEGSPTTVNFSGKPLFVLIRSTQTAAAVSTNVPARNAWLFAWRVEDQSRTQWDNYVAYNGEGGNFHIIYKPSDADGGVDFGENSISFYSTKSTYPSIYQLNSNYCSYSYIAILE